jgi:hypothetical protein
MLYGEGSKSFQMEDLFDDLDSSIADKREEATRLLKANEPYDEEDFTSDDGKDDEDDDVSIVPFITPESFKRYRKDGPFGKLRNIVQQAFRDAQQPCNIPLSWVYNVATRWSSDYAMATRALQLRGPLTRLVADIES